MHAHEDERAKKQKERYDKGRKRSTFKKKDKVWLIVQEPQSLGERREGPFEIVEKISELNYRIAEIGKAKMNNKHDVVNIKNIEHYNGEVEEQEWQVRRILSHREHDGGLHFMVEWAG